MNRDYTTFTREHFEAGKTINGGFTKQSLRSLGLPWPPQKGALDSLIGSVLKTSDIRSFIKGRNCYINDDGRRDAYRKALADLDSKNKRKKPCKKKWDGLLGRERTFLSMENRPFLLSKLGMKSYPEYLSSPLWKRIKQIAFSRLGNKCVICGERTNILHHKSYDWRTLIGEDFSFLVPICNRHHEEIEFDGTRKTTLFEANQRLESKIFLYKLYGKEEGIKSNQTSPSKKEDAGRLCVIKPTENNHLTS